MGLLKKIYLTSLWKCDQGYDTGLVSHMQIRQENVALAVSPFYIFHETKLQEGERTRIKELLRR